MSKNDATYIFEASEKPSLPLVQVPLVRATVETVKEYGYLVDHPDHCKIEIVQWPAQGWRPVDEGTGDEGGCVEGVFSGTKAFFPSKIRSGFWIDRAGYMRESAVILQKNLLRTYRLICRAV